MTVKKSIAALLCLLLAFSGCVGRGESGGKSPSAPPKEMQSAAIAGPSEEKKTAGTAEVNEERVNTIMQSLTTEQKVGQLFVVSFDDTEISEHTQEVLRETRIGNIILYGKNVTSGTTLRAMSAELQRGIMENTGVPAFIGIDQEGGRITRVTDGATLYPGAMAVAAANADTERLGKYMGEELHSLGINFDFAPSCDVNSNPNNPVINTRSYGDDPKRVAKLAAGMAMGLQSGGVMASVKHFPGHGDTDVDSHYGLALVDKSAEELAACELLPFRAAIDSGADAVMSAHILFPQLESERVPATMSKAILTGLLRESWGFEGLILTDSMRMDAITEFYGLGEGCVAAINAGVNLLVLGEGSERGGRDLDDNRVGYDAVLAAVRSGEITGETLDERVRRILSYKAKYVGLDGEAPPPLGEQTLGEHAAFALQTGTDSITTVRDTAALLPLSGEGTLVISPISRTFTESQPAMTESDSLAVKLAARLGGEALLYSRIPTPAETAAAVSGAKSAERVVVGCALSSGGGVQAALVKAVVRANPNTVVVLMDSPYYIPKFPEAKTLVCAYEDTPLAVDSLVQALTGQNPPSGTLPVNY